ncbi:MAG: hypothetical protein MPK75_01930 [Alphaproteobacteria bacterium]|nr:hypothetical protein [Alphaproteobacteria bacterium]
MGRGIAGSMDGIHRESAAMAEGISASTAALDAETQAMVGGIERALGTASD